ncbi:MAG: sugar transferase [Planctomycetes bacterium]|nr:sugar transferase [Planctomycetota bacterium]
MSQSPHSRPGSGDFVSLPDSELHNSRAARPQNGLFAARPAGLHVVHQSRFLDRLLLVLCTLPALAIALPVGLLNAIRFGSLRKVFFTQERIGLGGSAFVLWKFRTLTEPADGQVLTDQQRATPFGRFLRNTHLDELPQIFNVARGEMSFIGPRPEMTSIHEWACGHTPTFASRLVVRPGITGLAQVTQGYTTRSVSAYNRKLTIDHDYIMGRGWRLDLRILVMTAVWMLHGRGWQWKHQGDAVKESVLRALPLEFQISYEQQQAAKEAA